MFAFGQTFSSPLYTAPLCFSSEELTGIFVKSITEGSTADLDGRIQVNDQIIQVGCHVRKIPVGSFLTQQS